LSDPDLRRSFHGSMLPLIFGLPFAPGDNSTIFNQFVKLLFLLEKLSSC
jgi:hypothetical protein